MHRAQPDGISCAKGPVLKALLIVALCAGCAHSNAAADGKHSGSC